MSMPTGQRIAVPSEASVVSAVTHGTFSEECDEEEEGYGVATDCFQIPLRGREEEAKLLIDAIERISASSSPEFIQMIGKSGCGKTKLVEETLQPLKTCWFVASKFEELQQRIPFCAAISAFSDLLDLVLQSDEQVVSSIRDQLRRDLLEGEQALLGGLFSSFQYLLGIQDQQGYTEAATLYTPGEDEAIAFRRLKNAFKTLLRCIAAVHPVAILWDDLQWADPSTIMLLDSLIIRGRVLFVGSCREGEAGCSPQLEKFFTAKIKLENLSSDAILQVISDLTLLPPGEEQAVLLCNIIHAKTDGHPYFTVTFLDMLKESGLLWLEDGPSGLRWTFGDDATKITEHTDVSPNIVELLDAKIKTRLTTETYEVLSIAAHVGFRFYEELLVAVVGRPANEIKRILSLAEREGFIEAIPSATGKFKFAHDAIHHSLYQGDHAPIHLKIAETIEAHFDVGESVVFAYAEHLNRALSLLDRKEDHIKIAKANLDASNLARRRYAIFAAADYLRAGLNVMDRETMWHAQDSETSTYQLALELTAASAQMNYYCGNFATCKQQLEDVMKNARCEADKLQVFELLVEIKGAELEFDDAINIGITLIRQLGDSCPKNPNFLLLMWIFYRTKKLIGTMTDEEILALPDLDSENRTISVIIKILGKLCMYGVWTHNIPLLSIGAMRMIHLTLKHGQSNLSPYAFCLYGGILIIFPGCRNEAIRFGRLSLRMLERDPSRESEARTLMIAYSCLLHHVEPLQRVSDSFEQSCQSGLSTGDIENGLAGAAMCASADLNSGKHCATVAAYLRDLCRQVSEELKHERLFQIARPFWQMAENLMGLSDNPTTLTGEAMDESLMIADAADNMLLLQYCRLCQLELCVYFRNFHACPSLIKRIKKDEDTSIRPTFNFYFFKFFSALAYASITGSIGGEKARRGFRKCLKQVRSFDAEGTVNVPPLLKLLEAENLVLSGSQNSEDIGRAYKAAIESAGEMGFCNIQGLGCERYAVVLKAKGQREEATYFNEQACVYYSEFGAEAKVEHLQQSCA